MGTYNSAGYVLTRDKKQNTTPDGPFSALKEEKGHFLKRKGNHLKKGIKGGYY
jgi:hypothetical protein